jgi:hypothetical protein
MTNDQLKVLLDFLAQGRDIRGQAFQRLRAKAPLELDDLRMQLG